MQNLYFFWDFGRIVYWSSCGHGGLPESSLRKQTLYSTFYLQNEWGLVQRAHPSEEAKIPALVAQTYCVEDFPCGIFLIVFFSSLLISVERRTLKNQRRRRSEEKIPRGKKGKKKIHHSRRSYLDAACFGGTVTPEPRRAASGYAAARTAAAASTGWSTTAIPTGIIVAPSPGPPPSPPPSLPRLSMRARVSSLTLYGDSGVKLARRTSEYPCCSDSRREVSGEETKKRTESSWPASGRGMTPATMPASSPIISLALPITWLTAFWRFGPPGEWRLMEGLGDAGARWEWSVAIFCRSRRSLRALVSSLALYGDSGVRLARRSTEDRRPAAAAAAVWSRPSRSGSRDGLVPLAATVVARPDWSGSKMVLPLWEEESICEWDRKFVKTWRKLRERKATKSHA